MTASIQDTELVGHIITLGDAAVGKTCLLHRFCQDTYNDHMLATIGIEYFQRSVEIDDKTILMQVWDTSGQEKYKAISASFIKRADAVLLTYAVDNRQSFEHVGNWIEQIKNNTAEDVCTILVGSKCDVENRCVESSEGETLAKKLGVEFFETSAKENINIDKVFMMAANKVKEKLEGPAISTRVSMRLSTRNKDQMNDGPGGNGNPVQGGACAC